MQVYNSALRRARYENSEKSRRAPLPILLWAVSVFTLISCFGGEGFLGFQAAGFGWVVPFVLALFVLISRMDNGVRFPFYIWLPWILLVMIHLSVADTPHALQRSVMMLSPIAVGMAVSKFSAGEGEIEAFVRLCRYTAAGLFAIVVMKTGIARTGTMPMATALAAEAITSLLFAVFFATRYALWGGKAIVWWAAMIMIPLLAVTRSAILVAGLSLPLTFAPLNIWKRALIISLMAIIGVSLFYSERIQRKMFYSGHGTFADISLDNPDFRMTGRNTILKVMKAKLSESPWFGHGANASEPLVRSITYGLTHPHDDWLRLMYDYGYVGTFVFAACMSAQILHAFKRARRSTGEIGVLFYVGAASFIPFVMLMFTDNIIMYAAYYGNFQFTILGMAYAAQGAEDDVKAVSPRRFA